MRRPALCAGGGPAVAPLQTGDGRAPSPSTPAPTPTPAAATSEDCCYSTCDLKAAAASLSLASEGRLARVKRVLTGWRGGGGGGGAGGGGGSTAGPRVFGTPLHELPVDPDNGVPRVLVRLCSFIETHGSRCGGVFRLSAGSPKAVERLRAALDAAGDADLEGRGDAACAAALLRLWLRELPEPLLPPPTTQHLVALHKEMQGSGTSARWVEAAARALRAVPEPSLRALRFLLLFVRRHEQRSAAARCPHRPPGGPAAVLGPLLLPPPTSTSATNATATATTTATITTAATTTSSSSSGSNCSSSSNSSSSSSSTDAVAAAQQTLARLIADSPLIFSDRLLDHGVQENVVEEADSCIAPPAIAAAATASAPQDLGSAASGAGVGTSSSTYPSGNTASGQRKRKERHESCGSAQERKVVRSNSEERPLESGVSRCKDNIRRVNSHEDFSLSKTGRKLHPRNKHHTSSASNWTGDTSGCTFIIGEDDSSSSTKSTDTSSRSSNTTTATLTATGNSSHHLSSSSNTVSQPSNVSTVNNAASTTIMASPSTNTQLPMGSETNTGGTFVANNNNINHNNMNSSTNSKSFLSEVIDSNLGHGVRAGLPLQERNDSHLPSDNREAGVDEELDDTEHERRRSSERFARSAAPSRGRRNIGRRRRPTAMKSNAPLASSSVLSTTAPASVTAPVDMNFDDTDGGSSSKENEEQDSSLSRSHQLHTNVPSDEEGASSCSSSSHSFLQLHPQEHERSPSPEPSPGVAPPLDLTTLHQQVGSAEPVTSRATWSHQSGEHEEMIASSRVMLSPRNSLILNRRVYLDVTVSPPPHEHNSVAAQAQMKLKQLNKQANSLKKKIKKFEEDFEKEHGYRPSHSEKAANKDTKRLFTELNKLRKGIKQIKEDPNNVDAACAHGIEEESISSRIQSMLTMEEVIQEMELHLSERRRQAGRSEVVDEMNREQLLEEKVSVQKALLHLEDRFGRPVTKGDRDLVRPLYDRYRVLKRMVIRTAAAKMKDSISELATIHEHETMDFTSSPPSLGTSDEKKDISVTAAAAAAAAVVATGPPPPPLLGVTETSDVLGKNLHSLSLSELLSQQQSTREEKKRLRRSLREFEEDFQRRTGKKLQREDRLPMEEIYSSYKQAKAKLRLLDALVSKASM